MDFTELYKQSIAKFSPCASWIATAVDHRLVVRDAESLQIVALFNNPSPVSHLEWSMDSKLLLCACYSTSKHAKNGRGWMRCYAFSSDQQLHNNGQSPPEEWSAAIDEGIGGLVKCRLSPNGRQIFAWSDFQLKLTIWSLESASVHYIKYPKSDKTFAFRSDGRYFAYCERAEGKDFVGIVDTFDLNMIKHFPVQTSNLESIHWSPDGNYLALLEHHLEYRLLIYSPVGLLVHSMTSNEALLGIRLIEWSTSSQFLALITHDQTVSLLNNLTWSSLMDFKYMNVIDQPDVAVYQEVSTADTLLKQQSLTNCNQIRFKVQYQLANLPFTVPDNPLAKDSTIPLLSWSADGRFFAVKFSNSPSTLFIYDLKSISLLSVMVQMTAIKCVDWNPIDSDKLLISCADSGHVYLWSLSGCCSIQVPASGFQVQSVKWSPCGKSLAIMERDKFCLAFPLEEQEQQ